MGCSRAGDSACTSSTARNRARSGNACHKSLAPYRECRGSKTLAERNKSSGRGTFDRDDLKEAAGAAVRASVLWSRGLVDFGSWAGNIANQAPSEAGRTLLKPLRTSG